MSDRIYQPKFEPGKPACIIVDIDGTLANIDHRRHFVEGEGKKDWKSFFEAMPHDALNFPVWTVAHGYSEKKILVSGRSEEYRTQTETWLKQFAVEHDALFMRKEGDFREDSIIKEEIYHEHIAPFYNVFIVLDDRDRVVKMWRKLGLHCWQVADGNY